MFTLDQDTAIRQLDVGVYETTLSDRWSIGNVANGGYLLAAVMAGFRETLPSPDPLAVNAHYLRPGTPGPALVMVETIKTGRRFVTAMARLMQNDAEVLRVLATYGDLAAMTGPQLVDGRPPVLPPPVTGDQAMRPKGGMTIHERFDIQFDPATTAFLRGEQGERAEIRGWIRFADRRPHDVHALGLIADAFPPAVFQRLAPGWVPTLELTIHVRARPTSEWLACVFRSRFAQGGLLEEDGEMWDENGTLVAMSRQLALPPQGP